MPSGTSLAVLWLRLRTPRTGGAGGTLVRELSGHTQPERNNALRAGVDGSPPRVIRQLDQWELQGVLLGGSGGRGERKAGLGAGVGQGSQAWAHRLCTPVLPVNAERRPPRMPAWTLVRDEPVKDAGSALLGSRELKRVNTLAGPRAINCFKRGFNDLAWGRWARLSSEGSEGQTSCWVRSQGLPM